jgi:hypothetical protein
VIGTWASGAAIRPSRSRGKFEAAGRCGYEHWAHSVCRGILCEELARAGRGCFRRTGKWEWCVDDGGCVGLRHQKPGMMMEPLRRLRTWVSLARTPRVRWGRVGRHTWGVSSAHATGWPACLIQHTTGYLGGVTVSAERSAVRQACCFVLLGHTVLFATSQSERAVVPRAVRVGNADTMVANTTTGGQANATTPACTHQGSCNRASATGPVSRWIDESTN